MKTAHQLAAELLAGPDLPVYHFDPSRAGMDDERDTSVSEPRLERCEPEEVREGNPDHPFLIVHGDGGEPADEPGAFAELVIEKLMERFIVTREQLNWAQDLVRADLAARKA